MIILDLACLTSRSRPVRMTAAVMNGVPLVVLYSRGDEAGKSRRSISAPTIT